MKHNWEQRELKSEYDITMGQSPSSENYTSNPEDSILVQGNADIVNGWVEPRVWTTQVTKLAHRGDIILSVRAPVGELGKTEYDVVLGRGVAAIRGDEFIYQLLKKMKNDLFWRRLSTGSTFESINSKDLRSVSFFAPKKSEKDTIGKFLIILDQEINLHQRKINILIKLKQNYLIKMYPRIRNIVPELYFIGDNQAWEQRELNSVYNVTMGHSPKSENYTSNPEDYILVQGNADIKNGWVKPRVWTTQITSLVEAGSILISVRAPVGNIGKTSYDVVIGRGIAAIEGDEFIYQLLSKMHMESYWRKFSTGSTFESINSKDIKEASIKLPVEKERKKIGDFLAIVDSYVTYHQIKVNTLVKLKKVYLHKMFL